MMIEISIVELVVCTDFEHLDFHPIKYLGSSSNSNCRCCHTDLHGLYLHHPQKHTDSEFIGHKLLVRPSPQTLQNDCTCRTGWTCYLFGTTTILLNRFANEAI